MLIQSLLFFILGIASISWLLVLFSPLIWRRAVYFARKFVSTQIPLSVTEMQANYDFLCAQHAVELVRNEQKYNSLQKKYAQQKIQLSQTTEKLHRLYLSTQCNSYIQHEESIGIKDEKSAFTINNFIMDIKTMREKITHYLQCLEKIQTDEFDETAKHQLLDKLREDTKELAATLAAQIALQEGQSSPINTLIQNSQSKDDLASHISKKIAHTKKTPLT
ncbi:hypothetical protein [Bartonella sp. CB175]|uniref:hypothetical protein n=1 Tax=Bartonella sp. CB175 TaxID=3112256 RepID=UPI00300DBE3C